MKSIEELTHIHAPVERCFDLARSIDLHVASSTHTGEQAVAGVVSGLIGVGEEVTWRARHLGIRQELASKITAMERPAYFQDTMVRGAFRSFQHDHFFSENDEGLTEMKDILRFSAPIPLLGRIAEFFLRPYLREFLRERNALLKRTAESEAWRDYL